MRIFVFAMSLLIVLGGCETTAEHSFSGWGKDPEGAKGAIIWLHGWCPGWEDCSRMRTPEHIDRFDGAGWDVYRLNVPPSYANHDNAGWYRRAELHAKLALPYVKELREKGYSRVVLAGYSGGAVSALFAGTLTADVDAVLAVAPCCGVNPRGPYIPVGGLYRLLKNFKSQRLMIFFFEGERNAPANIGTRAKELLQKKQVTYVIVDRPEGFYGHGAGLTSHFATVFGKEIVAFAAGEI